MKYIDEYRSGDLARRYARAIRRVARHDWTIMEICGGQTHTIVKYGIDSLLPQGIELIHGPGCPVCVTPVEQIDRAISIASRRDVIFTSYGDMLRVPGSQRDLLDVKASGGDVRIVYSPLDALSIARANPEKKVVFFAVGFETTAPANAMAVWEAQRTDVRNFSILCAHVLVPPAIEAILSAPGNRIQGFLAAGHVCAVVGYEEYEPIARKYGVPVVVTGFEPVDILQGTYMVVKKLEQGLCDVANQYSRAVRREGNTGARRLMQKIYTVTHRKWRGIGEIPDSGLRLKDEFAGFDAEKIFDVADLEVRESPLCVAGQVLTGLRKPFECPAFGTGCTPARPLGAPMVSSEGACAAYYRYSVQRPKREELNV